MTQEERQLLLIDLASRIPYKVIGQVTFNRSPKQPCKKVIDGNLYDRFARAQDNWYDNVQIIPYLRPMQTITNEEIEERNQIALFHSGNIASVPSYMDWLNKHHFDYRGLIQKGLAITAPEGMYNTKNE